MSSSKGVLFLRNVNGEPKWFENGDENNDGKYIGGYKVGKRNGQGTWTSPDGQKYIGEWNEDKEWNGTGYNKNGEIVVRFVNGQMIEQ